jgi:plastocyanin
MRLTLVLALAVGLVMGALSLRLAAQEPITVEMRDFSFWPRDTRVLAGTPVRWINLDDAPHAIAMQGGKPGSSPGLIDPGKSHTFAFREAGRFVYRCGVHPTMLGEIIVEGP